MTQLTDSEMDDMARVFSEAAKAAKAAEQAVTAICTIGSSFAGNAPGDISNLLLKAQDFALAAQKAAIAIGPLKRRRNINEGVGTM